MQQDGAFSKQDKREAACFSFFIANFRKKFNKTIDTYANDWYNKYRKEVER